VIRVRWFAKKMDDAFKVYVEQLRDGHEETIDEAFDPGFLDIAEPDLRFDKPVLLKGVAYLADQELVLHWDIRTEVLLPCSICNESVRVSIHVGNFYHSESLEKIKSGIYNFETLLRETILLEAPFFAECHEGICPRRREYGKYLKESSHSSSDQDEGYRPFADVDWKL